MRILIGLALAACTLAAAEKMSDKELEAYLERMQRPERRFANIERSEGVWLRELVRKVNARRVLEIGTSTGYSGIWIARGLRETGGRLITIEYNQARYEAAATNFRLTGFDDLIEARHADALKETPKVEGPFDLVFIDALKPDYLKYYEMVLPKVRKGGVIVAHNVVSHPHEMRDFLERIQNDPKVKSEIVTPGYQGFSVSWVR